MLAPPHTYFFFYIYIYKKKKKNSHAPDLLDAHVVLVLGPDFPDAGMHSGIEAVSAYTRGLLWTFRGRNVIHIESVRERAEAYEAAGLTE